MPKEEGGLGFHEIQKFNDALLAKQLWRILTQPNLLMFRVLRAKYFPTGGLLKAEATNNASWLWKCWMGAKYVLEMGLRCQVGDGRSIRVWEVPWLHNVPKFIPQPKQPKGLQVTWARELMTSNGKEWNADLLLNQFSQKEAATIRTIPISQVGNKDMLVWNFNLKGAYTVQSAYHQLQLRDGQRLQQAESSSGPELEKRMWKRTWSMQIKGKLKNFIWRCFHNVLPTRTQLAKKGFHGDLTCPMCGEGDEQLEHLFFNCRRARIVWKLAPVSWEGLERETEHFH